MRRIDITGQRFGRLLATAIAPSSNANMRWKCICDCGRVVVVAVGRLTSGRKTSCGCEKAEAIARRIADSGHFQPDLAHAEEWRPASSVAPEWLEASSYGRIRSVLSDPRILPPYANKQGHLYVGARVEGVVKQFSVHRTICAAFHGPPPRGRKSMALHNDGDPLNNRPNNLRWGSGADNAGDRDGHGRTMHGVNCHLAKATPTLVREFRDLYAGGRSARSIALEHGFSPSAVLDIVKRRTWRRVA